MSGGDQRAQRRGTVSPDDLSAFKSDDREEETEGVEIDPRAFEVPELLPGDRAEVTASKNETQGNKHRAQVRFVGTVRGLPQGYWIGVQYEDKVGKNDGMLNGRRYFRCPPHHGGFVRASRVVKLDGARDSSPNAARLDQPASAADPSFSRYNSTAEQGEQPSSRPGGDGTQDTGSMASRIARRRQESARERSPTKRGGGERMTLVEWQRDVGPLRADGAATPDRTYATGPALATAIVGSLAQFTIIACNSSGERTDRGGDAIEVVIRGDAGASNSQPAQLRTKMLDRSDGSYIVEYRPWLTGQYVIWVTLDGCNVTGSPFTLSVVTPRPNASRSIVRGDALRKALARQPMKFEVLFVDACGDTAQAEDLDVWIEQVADAASSVLMDAVEVAPGRVTTEKLSSERVVATDSVSTDRAAVAVVDLVASAEAPLAVAEEVVLSELARVEEVSVPTTNASGDDAGYDSVDSALDVANEGSGGVATTGTGAVFPTGDPLVASTHSGAMAERRRRTSPRRHASPRRLYAPQTSLSPRRERRVGGHTVLDATIRQRHMQLWALRLSADKKAAANRVPKESAEGDGKRKKGMDAASRTANSYAHELSVDPLGFAFGGVDPGTLHAHGKLVKVHSAHFSVGKAGLYKLHVGLRQQMLPLPGSPFDLLVEPGYAYAASSVLPVSSLPLSGVASEDWHQGLIFSSADTLSNACKKGGADVLMRLALTTKVAAREQTKDKDSDGDKKLVDCDVVDRSDGTYELKWRSNTAGVFPIDVLLDGSHVVGSPIELHVRPAQPAVEKMVVSGAGMSEAVAGIEAVLQVRVADRFGNLFEAGSFSEGSGGAPTRFPYEFGLVLSSAGAEVKNTTSQKTKAAKGNEKAEGVKRAKEDPLKAPSIQFIGQMSGSVYEIRYVAQEAGMMDLHLWATPLDGGSAVRGADGGKAASTDEVRVWLPGSPFTVAVAEGSASASGSSVGGAEAGKQGAGFVAGEHVILKPVVRDSFGNHSAPVDGALSTEHVKPGAGGHEQLAPPKQKGGLGSYEIAVEPTRAGMHYVHVRLGGQDITGSPVSFEVVPAAPAKSKCKVRRALPPEDEPLMEKANICIEVTLYDKYSNQLKHGGVRVDAKASGVGVSGAKVEDNKNGTYSVTLTAGPPGEIRVVIRIDGDELTPYLLTVQRNPEPERGEGGADAAIKEVDPKDAAAEVEGGEEA